MNTNTEYATIDKIKINPSHCNLLIAFTVLILVISSVRIAEEVIYILNAARIPPEHFHMENTPEFQMNITAPLENGKNISRSLSNDAVLRYLKTNSTTFKTMFITQSVVYILFYYIPIIGISASIMSIIKNMKDQYHPFLKDNSKKIVNIGGNIILLGFAKTLNLFGIVIFSYHKVWIGLRLQEIDIVLIAVGFLLIILSRIFNYGSYLQKEYDETI